MTARPSKSVRTDSVSFETLYTAHHRAVLAYCSRRAARTDAWDAAADVFLVAWRRMDKVPEGDAALPWLFGVAYKTLSNQRRGSRRRRRLEEKMAGMTDEATQSGPELQIVRHEEEVEVVEALQRLRPLDREILTLSLWEELSPTDISTALGISRAAVDKRYQRAKERLADELRENTQINATHEPIEEGGAA